MTLYKFLRDKTAAGEFCIICDGGWPTAATWIDYEDLFLVNTSLIHKEVAEDRWEKYLITQRDGSSVEVDAHVIELE